MYNIWILKLENTRRFFSFNETKIFLDIIWYAHMTNIIMNLSLIYVYIFSRVRLYSAVVLYRM